MYKISRIYKSKQSCSVNIYVRASHARCLAQRKPNPSCGGSLNRHKYFCLVAFSFIESPSSRPLAIDLVACAID